MTANGTKQASVLIVDDTVENLRLLASMLGDRGYEVRPVTSGPEALKAVAHDPPDLVLLDIDMPDMDGYEVCRRLKESEASRDVPVIFVTAFTDPCDKVRAFESGGVDYITKPFHIEEVLARVRVHVELTRARKELAQNYARLRQLERLRDNLVHMVVHDMRTPLQVLLLTISIVRERAKGLSPEVAEDLRNALAGSQMLTRLCNDLLDVSRLEEGKMPLRRLECDLAEIARGVGTNLAGLDPEREIRVEADGAVQARCDGTVIHRVIENLVSNGIKHTPKGGLLRVVAARAATGVRVAVHDQGPGIPVAARGKIFEKFGTIEVRAEQTYHSTGLGLTFCKLAIEAHGGTLSVDSPEAGGSIFWFELPAR